MFEWDWDKTDGDSVEEGGQRDWGEVVNGEMELAGDPQNSEGAAASEVNYCSLDGTYGKFQLR